MAQKCKYSVIIPVYNGAQYLVALHEALSSFFQEFEQGTVSYELVFVNDGSSDNTLDQIKQLAEKDNHITAINLSRNYGQHNATLCALRESKGEICITMDCDLQHKPTEIPKLLKSLESGKKLVYGKYDYKRHGIMQNLGSWFMNKVLCDITGRQESITSFRVFRRELVDLIEEFDNPRVILDIMFSHVIAPKDVDHVIISHNSTVDGESTYTFWKLCQFALDMLFNYSVVPLRIASVIGMVLSTVSFVLGAVYLVLYLLGKIIVPGFTVTILAITFFSGIILFTQGIFGEYLGRIFLISTRRPQYKVSTVYPFKILGHKKDLRRKK